MSNASRGAPEQEGGVTVLTAVQPLRRHSPALRHGEKGPFLRPQGSLGSPRMHSPLPKLSPSRTVPGAGEDAGGCVISSTSCLRSHTEVFLQQSKGVTQ